ncbi:hypothetical protein [Neorhizobium sp. JUb45]|uniref:hypothetical protein n=1 Tax=unclassified Neorhizobium TaxID=2629175 RepID=UPI00104E819C|nr:hypothetical protein [Neorhizobium sp. JUb45]TCR04125.1 hypothetical protein EDF70_102223 [Neorhizobium sp. JUb45]
MKTSQVFRSGLGVTAIVAVLAGVSGCQSPTYGTSKSAAEQLADDLGSAVSIGGGDKKKDVRYNPRPGLVVAGKGVSDLPAPQQSMANRENNPNWAESPEETRQRLREEAAANENNPRYVSPLTVGKGQGGQLTESQKWEAFRQAKAEAKSGSTIGSGQRRFLTDPPAEYRQVDNADDLGEPEKVKERRRKKEAEANGKQNSAWWKPFQ